MSIPVPISLTATVRRTPELLHIAYRIANAGTVAAFVSVRTRLDFIATRRPYTLFREQTGSLLLSMQTAPIPPGLNVYVPVLPLYHRLPAGQEYDDFAEVEIPVHELHPYCNPAYLNDTMRVNATGAVFVLEYVLEPDVHFIREDKDNPGLVRTRGDPMVPLESSLVLDAPLPVLKRTDDFYRW